MTESAYGATLRGMSLAIALVALLTVPALASHTVRTTIEIQMGEVFDLLRGAGELVDVSASPPGILEILPGGKIKVEAECTRPGKTVVTLRYGEGGAAHTAIIAVTCVQPER